MGKDREKKPKAKQLELDGMPRRLFPGRISPLPPRQMRERTVGDKFRPPESWRSAYPTPTEIGRGKVNWDNLKLMRDIFRLTSAGVPKEDIERIIKERLEARRSPRQLTLPGFEKNR